MADKLKPFLEKIDAARYYSNHGPLLVEFEKRLAAHFGAEPDEIVTSANGTLALIQMLRALDVKPGSVCVVPSWTFTATPAAAIAAGMVPFFVDVNRADWSFRPEDVVALLGTHTIGAVIPVAPFGAPIDIVAWERFQADTGIPVIIDAAGGFDSFSAHVRRAKVTIPFMVSLHATKVLGIGEGAVIVTHNAALAKRMGMLGNFGFYGSRESQIPAINAKLSEYSAAVGLAALDEWPEKRKKWLELSMQFEKLVHTYPELTGSPKYNQGWVSSYGLIELSSQYVANDVRKELDQKKVGTLCWWGMGCHAQPAYRDCPHADLSVTEYLAQHVLSLPFWVGLKQTDLTLIFNCLAEVLKHSVKSESN